MDAQTCHLLPNPISIKLWGTDEERTFERVSDVLDWCEVELATWTANPGIKNSQLGALWEELRGQANYVRTAATQLANHLNVAAESRPRDDHYRQELQQFDAQLRNRVQFFADGRAISSSHPAFAYIQAIAEKDGDAAAALLAACSANGQQALSQFQALDAIARIGFAGAYLESARGKTIKALRADFSTLRKRAEEDISALRTSLDEQTARADEVSIEHHQLLEERARAWTELVKRCDEEWASLKQVYDEKLALLAPTEYWHSRTISHNKLGLTYAIAFGGVLLVLVALFIAFGIDHLGSPGTQSVVLAVLPVLVPAFAGIWVLRILGRLLSENLKIAQDAQERETMVKTFLALMRDESAGKAVIQNDDRRLILEALFRQSTVTATDDAPPLHWLAALRSNTK